jgi:hypothetical protein
MQPAGRDPYTVTSRTGWQTDQIDSLSKFRRERISLLVIGKLVETPSSTFQSLPGCGSAASTTFCNNHTSELSARNNARIPVASMAFFCTGLSATVFQEPHNASANGQRCCQNVEYNTSRREATTAVPHSTFISHSSLKSPPLVSQNSRCGSTFEATGHALCLSSRPPVPVPLRALPPM